MSTLFTVLLVVYAVVQIAYLLSLAVTAVGSTLPIDLVDPDGAVPEELPRIMLLYPVLREAEETMRTTMTAIGDLDYPADRYRVVGIPNHDDAETIASLERLQAEFSFLELLVVPPTSDPSWDVVWLDWEANSKAYWWHVGKRAGVTELPAKKTRQLVYALYTTFHRDNTRGWLVSYMDADSAPQKDLFRLAAIGSKDYEVLQTTNVAGNLMASMPASFYALDHLSWDSSLWQHQSAHGRQPFWVLGKGLFFRAEDLLDFGGFHPWLTIEDPEVGMRLWTNGRRLGVIRDPLIEEVPDTFSVGTTQRKRWVAGFFQSLHTPLVHMGMTTWQRFRARLNFVPCLSLLVNAAGLPVGIAVLVMVATGSSIGERFPTWLVGLSVVNIALAVLALVRVYLAAWRHSTPVLPRARDRALYLLRVNPVFLIVHWALWAIPLVIGFTMFLRDTGLSWERTEKKDQNHELVRAGRTVGPVIDLREGVPTMVPTSREERREVTR